MTDTLPLSAPPELAPRPDLLDVAAAVTARLDDSVERLSRLARIPSISVVGHDRGPLRISADATADLLRDVGLERVRFLEVEGAPPYVTGEWLHAPGAPTLLLYAHHDVQPIGAPDKWVTPPFEPTVRDGRLYGRGTADDKAGIVAHAAAIRAWLETRGSLPLNVKVIIEGEEEIGSPNLMTFLGAYAEELRSDVIVLADATNWKTGWPAITYTLRGLIEVYVTVRALEAPVHSGMWGGPVPDALTGLLKALASLNDDDGRPSVAGLFDDVRAPTARERELFAALGADEDELRAEAGVLDGVAAIGDPSLSYVERLWMQPTITVTGIDVPSVLNASNQLIAESRAKVTVRLAPGQDPQRVRQVMADHLRGHVPWGLHTEVTYGAASGAWVTEPTGPTFEAAIAAMRAAFGRDPALIGCGGSIPFVEPFSDAFGGAPCLLTGLEDPLTQAHGDNESLHLGDFAKAIYTEAFLFAELADRAGTLRG